MNKGTILRWNYATVQFRAFYHFFGVFIMSGFLILATKEVMSQFNLFNEDIQRQIADISSCFDSGTRRSTNYIYRCSSQYIHTAGYWIYLGLISLWGSLFLLAIMLIRRMTAIIEHDRIRLFPLIIFPTRSIFKKDIKSIHIQMESNSGVFGFLYPTQHATEVLTGNKKKRLIVVIKVGTYELKCAAKDDSNTQQFFEQLVQAGYPITS
jgi:hypothetical protein